jgi:hypothetical protein
MMLAPTLVGRSPRSALRLRRPANARSAALDATLLIIAMGVCGVLFFDGGLEAMIGSALGAAIAIRKTASPAALCSGAFAGLWIGAMFAGFFHEPIVAVLTDLT